MGRTETGLVKNQQTPGQSSVGPGRAVLREEPQECDCQAGTAGAQGAGQGDFIVPGFGL